MRCPSPLEVFMPNTLCNTMYYIVPSSRFFSTSPWIPSSPGVLWVFSLLSCCNISSLFRGEQSMSFSSVDIYTNISTGFSHLSNNPKYCLHFSNILSCSVTREPLSFLRNFSYFLYPPLIEFIFGYNCQIYNYIN